MRYALHRYATIEEGRDMLINPEPHDTVEIRTLSDESFEVVHRRPDGSETVTNTRELCLGPWSLSETVRGRHDTQSV